MYCFQIYKYITLCIVLNKQRNIALILNIYCDTKSTVVVFDVHCGVRDWTWPSCYYMYVHYLVLYGSKTTLYWCYGDVHLCTRFLLSWGGGRDFKVCHWWLQYFYDTSIFSFSNCCLLHFKTKKLTFCVKYFNKALLKIPS